MCHYCHFLINNFKTAPRTFFSTKSEWFHLSLILFNNPHCSVQFTQIFFRLLFDSLKASHKNLLHPDAAAITEPNKLSLRKNRFLFVFWFSSHLSLASCTKSWAPLQNPYEKRKKSNLILTRHFFMTLIVSFSFALFVYYNIQRYFSKSHIEMKKTTKNCS